MKYLYAVYDEASRQIVHIFNTEYEAQAFLAFLPYSGYIGKIKGGNDYDHDELGEGKENE